MTSQISTHTWLTQDSAFSWDDRLAGASKGSNHGRHGEGILHFPKHFQIHLLISSSHPVGRCNYLCGRECERVSGKPISWPWFIWLVRHNIYLYHTNIHTYINVHTEGHWSWRVENLVTTVTRNLDKASSYPWLIGEHGRRTGPGGPRAYFLTQSCLFLSSRHGLRRLILLPA